ncbi:MAG TPA: uroporphyrinogen decarboxylase [Thermoanaerobaculia bacterium]|nr:uroporphyrinogen decarboxylase [Thermoanaerobaculia bacterium]
MNDLFLRACRGEPTERRPVWIMRQAGRYLPEYRALRQKVDFLTLCKTPELAAEATLQPIARLGVDAAILFADILLPLEAMGAELEFVRGDGPTFPRPVRRREDIAGLRLPDVEETLGYVFTALRLVRRELAGKVPVIGFGGTPWTLAAYLVEGGGSRHFEHLLAWSYGDPEGLALLLDRIADTSLAYLRGQLAAGAQALQLFDTWGGLLDAERWRSLALPPLRKVVDGLRGQAPLIYYIHGGSHLLASLGDLPVEVLSVDWRLPLGQVRPLAGGRVLQGNLDPAALLAPRPEIERRVAALLAEGAGGGHIVNLGHGILPMTPVENARAFVELAQRLSTQPAAPHHARDAKTHAREQPRAMAGRRDP